MSRALGEGFYERFARYAQEHVIPREGGPLADGRLFALALARAGEFPEEARLEALAFDARYADCGDGFIPRRGFSIKAAAFRRPPGLALVIRGPWIGERWLRFKLPLTL